MYCFFLEELFHISSYVVENLRNTSVLLVTEEELFQLQAKELVIKSKYDVGTNSDVFPCPFLAPISENLHAYKVHFSTISACRMLIPQILPHTYSIL